MDGTVFCTARTAYGAVEGLVSDGIHQFKGVPYGAPTNGEGRFAPPRALEPWTGVRECHGYGRASPQVPTPDTLDYGRLIQWDLTVAQGGMGEDCLHLNLWTPGLGDGGKRPVLVSFHGGGFHIGSSAASIYDGARLARLGDVVVVSVNHRLASFGYLNLADIGASADFADAGVAGLMDLVAALEWVRDNIEGFGGDPGRVMIFGQSGGGWKTSALLAARAARGLFHRAAVQSGSAPRLLARETSAAAAAALISDLGIAKADIARLREVPWQSLLAAQARVGSHAFQPSAGGDWLPDEPCTPAALALAADVPLIVSTTLDDAGLFSLDFQLTETELRERLDARFGCGGELLALYRSYWPDKATYLLQAQITTDAGFRRLANRQAELKSAQPGAKVWTYLWTWASPGFDGRFGAAHAMDAAASFANDREAILGSGSADAFAMCRQLAGAWVAFARTGDPNTDELPSWAPFDPDLRHTILLGPNPSLSADPWPEIRAFWDRFPEPQTVLG